MRDTCSIGRILQAGDLFKGGGNREGHGLFRAFIIHCFAIAQTDQMETGCTVILNSKTFPHRPSIGPFFMLFWPENLYVSD